MEKKLEPTNVPTAKLRIQILKFVMKYDYYPNDWFSLNEANQELMENKITYEEYDSYVQMLLESWK